MRYGHNAAAHRTHICIKRFLELKVLLAGINIAQPAMKFIVNGLKTELLLSSATGSAVLVQHGG
jgi:hypothetical protein